VHRRRTISGRKGERGVVILLVAIVLLFVVGAMAVLAIDLVTFYTARSEAQLAADGAALTGARVLANSGATSDPTNFTLEANAHSLAITMATQVAVQNKVGGRNLNAGEVAVSFPNQASPGFGSNPRITVQVTRSDLPTFFARIWGRTQVTVTASATAEAYNPSGLTAMAGSGPPIAPVCVKPWVLPNLDPRPGITSTIFDASSGAITDASLMGWSDVLGPANLGAACTDCTGIPSGNPAPQAWKFYPGAQLSFPAPTQALPVCSVGFTAYRQSIAGCVQTPIACNGTVALDTSNYGLNRHSETADAVNCLTHSANDKGDSVDTLVSPPFQFLAGDDNPVVGVRETDVLVSDSLVTVPVYDSLVPVSGTVQVIGFVQLFLNPDGLHAPNAPNPVTIKTTIVNLAGCGTNATGQPILGNGASAVPVRLVTP
jgi:hypothetical protein